MTHVVAEPCVNCRYTDCVTVCPVDCFHEDETMLVINPEGCIDCGACIPECPVQAIYTGEDLPAQWQSYTQLNAEKSPNLPVITETKEPLAKDRPA